MTTIRTFGWVVAIGLLIAGGVVQSGLPVADWVTAAWSSLYESKPVVAVVVRESADTAKLTKEQIAWIGSPALRAAAKAAGVQFLVVDPDVVAADGKTPTALAPAIELAKKKGLPRLILIGSRKGLTDYVLPADEAAATKRITGK
jgi:hypothetical protein